MQRIRMFWKNGQNYIGGAIALLVSPPPVAEPMRPKMFNNLKYCCKRYWKEGADIIYHY